MAAYLDMLPDLPVSENPYVVPCYYAMGISPEGKAAPVPCPTRDAVERACMDYSAKGWSAYFANAAFKDSTKGRTKQNVHALGAFWLDVDVGKKANSYETREAALAAVYAFCEKTGTEPSYIVSSGFGLYVYWVLSSPIPPTRWTAMAKSLGTVCREHGLIVDPACTTDCSRILRLPGTVHPKSGNTVSILSQSGTLAHDPDAFSAWLAKMGAKPEVAPEPKAAPGFEMFGAVADPFVSAPTYRAQPIVRNCPQILMSGKLSEPTWFAAMSVLKRCVDGREWTHRLSAMDPARYDEAATDAKFDHAPADAPYTCSKFEELDPRWCAECRWRGSIKSPAELYRRCPEVEEAAAPTAEPEPQEDPQDRLVLDRKFRHSPLALKSEQFNVTKHGVVWTEYKKRRSGDVDTIDHTIADAPIYYLFSTFERKNDRVYEWVHYFQSWNEEKPISLPTPFAAEDFASPTQIYAKLFNMFVISNDLQAYTAPLFLRFMNTYMSSLAKNKALRAVDVVDQFGWRTLSNGRKAFSIGAGLITETGLIQQKYSGTVADDAQFFSHAGNLETWCEIPRMYGKLNQYAGMLAFCLCFGSVLMPYISGTATSAIFSLWSVESGLGKTQLLRALATVWGDPDRQFIQRNTSPAAKERALAVRNNIPAFMDELTDVSEQNLFSLAYTLVGGQEKLKMKRNGKEMVATGKWNNVTFCTSNRSMKEIVSHNAGDSIAAVVRIIELECNFESFADRPETQKYITDCIELCGKHYGLAGPEFVYRVLRDGGRLKGLSAQIDHWVAEHAFPNEERFVSYPIALAMRAGRWAVEWGLLDYDMDDLERWVCGTFAQENRLKTGEYRMDPNRVLYDYIMSRQRNMLVVKTDSRRGRPPMAGQIDNDYVLAAPLNADILIRLSIKEPRMYISVSDFDYWCQRRRISGQNVLRKFGARGLYIAHVRKSLSSGTPRFNLPSIACAVLERDVLEDLGYEYNPEYDPAKDTPVEVRRSSNES